MASVPDDVEVVGDALTSVRKRDWGRLVDIAAAGTTIRLTDPDLSRDVVLAAIDPGSETLIAHTPEDGAARGRTLTGWDAARARGRRTHALLEPLVDVLEEWIEDEDADRLARATDAARAWTYIVGLKTTKVTVGELTAAHGRNVLRAAADPTPTADDVPHLMAHIVTGRPGEAVLMTAWPLESLASTTFTDDDEVVTAIRWLPGVWRDALDDTVWNAWTDTQAGRPWGADRVIDAVHDALAGAGITARPAAEPQTRA